MPTKAAPRTAPNHEKALFFMLGGMVRSELSDIGKKSRTGDPSSPKSKSDLMAEVRRRIVDKAGAGAPADVVQAVTEVTDFLVSQHIGQR